MKKVKTVKAIVRGTQPTGYGPSPDHRLVAVMCPLENCGEEFPLKKKGDFGSYNIAAYQKHLRFDHNLFTPKPVEVWGF